MSGELKAYAGKGGSVASQRKHKTAENKHESDGHCYCSNNDDFTDLIHFFWKVL